MRLKQLIMMQSADLANSIVMAGHSYAMTHASSALNSAGRQRELFSGMTQVGGMSRIDQWNDRVSSVASVICFLWNDVNTRDARSIGKSNLYFLFARCQNNACNETSLW